MINQIKDNGDGPRLAEFSFAVLRIALNKVYNEEILHHLPLKSVTLPQKRRTEFTPLTPEKWAHLFATAESYVEMYTVLTLEWTTVSAAPNCWV